MPRVSKKEQLLKDVVEAWILDFLLDDEGLFSSDDAENSQDDYSDYHESSSNEDSDDEGEWFDLFEEDPASNWSF